MLISHVRQRQQPLIFLRMLHYKWPGNFLDGSLYRHRDSRRSCKRSALQLSTVRLTPKDGICETYVWRNPRWELDWQMHCWRMVLSDMRVRFKWTVYTYLIGDYEISWTSIEPARQALTGLRLESCQRNFPFALRSSLIATWRSYVWQSSTLCRWSMTRSVTPLSASISESSATCHTRILCLGTEYTGQYLAGERSNSTKLASLTQGA